MSSSCYGLSGFQHTHTTPLIVAHVFVLFFFPPRSLLDRHGGVVFEPELDENVSEAATQQDYFSKVTNDQELLALIERMELEKAEVEEEQEEEEEEGEVGGEATDPFKRIEKRMTNVLEDGGVKKKVFSPTQVFSQDRDFSYLMNGPLAPKLKAL